MRSRSPLYVTLAVSTLLLFGAVTGAQAQSANAVVIADAPIMLLPDPARTPLQVVPAGTRLLSLGVEGQWMRVQWDDSRLGRRSGYIESRFVSTYAPPPAARQETTPTAVAPAPEPRQIAPTATKPPITVAPVAEAPRAAGPAAEVLAARDALTDAEIDAAIAAGQKEEPKLVGCFADVRFAEALNNEFSRGYSVIVRGPFSRIASAAAEAKRKYLQFQRSDVTDAHKMKLLTITVYPDKPAFASRRWQRAAPATHLVIRPKAEDKTSPQAVIQPSTVEAFPVSWSNAFGMKFEGQGVVTMFSADRIPTGIDLDVIVVTDLGERDCTIRKGDWARVR